jgi:glycine dehydrogenase subunit 1
MPFIPHTEDDVSTMLATIGVDSIEALFDEIPQALRVGTLDSVPPACNEMQISRLMAERAASDGHGRCFLGAGAYEHHIPAAVWEITTRGEFYSAYTPYQAEASQGTLQLIYEYQTMMTRLMAMDVSNASLYDGASGLAEAILMAVRANRKSKARRILVPATLNPVYRHVSETIVRNQGITLDVLDYDTSDGRIAVSALPDDPGDVTAIVIPQPNFFGTLEDVDALTDWAHRHGALVIAVVNPTAMAMLSPPGEWGNDEDTRGADIVCGEGQPLGIPLSSGGPYFGFMCCKQQYVRQMPGRIVGRTVDLEGKTGFTLTLQAREQHIRRSKATSNICTNQGLMVTAATIYLALLGGHGLQQAAQQSHRQTRRLRDALTAIPGVSAVFNAPFFHETVIRFDEASVDDVLDGLAVHDILGGHSLKTQYPELGEALLVCATETRTDADVDDYARALADVVSSNGG